MSSNRVLEAMRKRRSVRSFGDEAVSGEMVEQILEAGRWAPSGLNNQPWRFVIVRTDEVREQLAGCTKYAAIIRKAPVNICVYLDKDKIYNRDKDLQSAGACLQNMLLAAHALGLGAVWLGEILNQRDKVNEVLGVDDNKELMAVISLGHPQGTHGEGKRNELKDLILKEI